MISTVIFDVGWVLVHLQPRPMLDLLAAHGADALDLESVVARIALEDHESGRLDGRGLLDRLAGLAGRPLARAELHTRWLDMFELQPRMVDLAHRLADRYRVYLLSNVGDLHWAHLSREYGLHRIGHGVLPSYVAGVMKPHAGIYAEAERRFALEPGATVFVDDRVDNVEAARSRGWHGIVHSGYESTRDRLAALGVEIR